MQPLGTLAGLFDELEKIAENADPSNKERTRRWLKGTAAVAIGTGLGTGAYMLGERALNSKLGPTWQNLSQGTKRSIAGGIAGLATLGGMALAQRLAKEKQEHDEGHE